MLRGLGCEIVFFPFPLSFGPMHPKHAPTSTLLLPTRDGLHELHVAEYGAPGGTPIVYLHGGPGGGTPPDVPRLFDPAVFRLVTFDQLSLIHI